MPTSSYMNWSVRADFPTPPLPTMITLCRVSEFWPLGLAAAMALHTDGREGQERIRYRLRRGPTVLPPRLQLRYVTQQLAFSFGPTKGAFPIQRAGCNRNHGAPSLPGRGTRFWRKRTFYF